MVGLKLSLKYAVNRPSKILKPRCKHNPSAQMFGRGTQHTALEKMPVQFLQQDRPRQVLCWRVETTAIQRYTARQGIVCNLGRNLLQDDNR